MGGLGGRRKKKSAKKKRKHTQLIINVASSYVHAQTDDGSDDNSWLDYGSFCDCMTLHAHDQFHPHDNVTAKVCNDFNGTTNDWPADPKSISFLKHVGICTYLLNLLLSIPAIPVLTFLFLCLVSPRQCDFDFDDAEAAVTTFAESCRTADQEYFHLNVTGAQCCPKGDGACQGDNTPPPEEIPPPTNKTEKRQDEDYFVDKTAFCQCSQAFPNETFNAVRVSTYEVCDWYNQTGGAIDVPKYTTESEGTIAHVCSLPFSFFFSHTMNFFSPLRLTHLPHPVPIPPRRKIHRSILPRLQKRRQVSLSRRHWCPVLSQRRWSVRGE